jgi:hypothetical protein
LIYYRQNKARQALLGDKVFDWLPFAKRNREAGRLDRPSSLYFAGGRA